MDAVLGASTLPIWAAKQNWKKTYQVVLVQEGVHMFKEGDGRRTMDDPVNLSMQLCQLMLTQPAVRLAWAEEGKIVTCITG